MVTSELPNLIPGLLFNLLDEIHRVLKRVGSLNTLERKAQNVMIGGLLLQDVQKPVVLVMLHAVDDWKGKFSLSDVLAIALSFHVL